MVMALELLLQSTVKQALVHRQISVILGASNPLVQVDKFQLQAILMGHSYSLGVMAEISGLEKFLMPALQLSYPLQHLQVWQRLETFQQPRSHLQQVVLQRR
jgi:hypothetical protein